MAYPGSFPSSCGKSHPNPKSYQEVDSDKRGCITSHREVKPKLFVRLFSGFLFLIPNSAN